MGGIALLLLVAGVVVMLYKRRQPVLIPGHRETTVKPWVWVVLIVLGGLLLLGSAGSDGPEKQPAPVKAVERGR